MSQIQEIQDVTAEAVEGNELIELPVDELDDVNGGAKVKVSIEIEVGN